MRIGIVSDTHNNHRNVKRIVELFRTARVERVIHTGDITQPRTLRAIAEVGVPIVGVFGNNDDRSALRGGAAELGIELAEPPFEWVLGSHRVLVAHDPVELEGAVEDQLRFNPGECAGHLAGRQTVGVVDLSTLEPELLHF